MGPCVAGLSMVKLYAFNLASWIHDGHWRSILPALPERRQQRALACQTEADSARIAGAGWLLQWALTREGIPPSEQIFENNPWGKPFLAHSAQPHFSLSHSGVWAVCSIGQHSLGIDIELPRCTRPTCEYSVTSFIFTRTGYTQSDCPAGPDSQIGIC